MMMTAAGTVAPARVLVLGAGVAGLQAIATARRLGAVVSATDVRAAAKEQVESLGATFIEVDDEAIEARDAGGYAREMGEAYRRKQRSMLAEALQEAGHRDLHRADPRPAGAAPDHRGDGARHEAGLGHRRPRGRAGRQCRALRARRDGDDATASGSSATSTCPAASPVDASHALRAQPAQLPRAPHRQGDQGAEDRLRPTRSSRAPC